MNSDPYDLILREGPGPDPLPPRFTTAAYLKMVDAEISAAIANGTLSEKLGKFEEVHRGEPFVWDDAMEAAIQAARADAV